MYAVNAKAMPILGRPYEAGAPEVESLLNKQSGLLGISGLTHDMRELLAEAHEHDDRRARLAIDIFCYRARKYIGAYLAAIGGAMLILSAITLIVRSLVF